MLLPKKKNVHSVLIVGEQNVPELLTLPAIQVHSRHPNTISSSLCKCWTTALLWLVYHTTPADSISWQFPFPSSLILFQWYLLLSESINCLHCRQNNTKTLLNKRSFYNEKAFDRLKQQWNSWSIGNHHIKVLKYENIWKKIPIIFVLSILHNYRKKQPFKENHGNNNTHH